MPLSLGFLSANFSELATFLFSNRTGVAITAIELLV